jgi:uncharacterized membrane protein (DUF2068 family)
MPSQSMPANTPATKLAERGVAALEFLKGLAVVLIGAGFATMLHRDRDVEDVAVSLLYVLHISHHHHLSAIFLRAAGKLQDSNLIVIAICAGVYSLLRFVEAYGLWNARVWAEWFALISGSIYLPLEVYELFRRSTPVRFSIFFLNIVIVAYMAWLRWKAHARKEPQQPLPDPATKSA